MRGQDLRGEQIIDSRDVIARIEELEGELSLDYLEGFECKCLEAVDEDGEPQEPREPKMVQCGTCGWEWCERCHPAPSARSWCEGIGPKHLEDEAEELAALKALAEEGENSAGDWEHGATLIREDYFETYAQELAEDIGAVPKDLSWPACHIDWEAAADALKAGLLFGGLRRAGILGPKLKGPGKTIRIQWAAKCQDPRCGKMLEPGTLVRYYPGKGGSKVYGLECHGREARA